MTDLLERTIRETQARQLPDVGPAPPETPVIPPATGGPPTGGPAWPPSAKLVVAILAVAALLAALGTWAATRAEDDRELDDRQEQIDELTGDLDAATAQVTTITGDLDAANERVATLTAERDELDGRIAELDAELATTAADVDRLTAERTGLLAERAALQASLAAAEGEVADLEAQLDTAADTTATLDERLAALTVEVGALTDRAEVAETERAALVEWAEVVEAQRDELRGLFPIRIESSLQDVDVTGTWNVTWDEAYCTAFPTCGRAPTFGRITITETPEGYLRVNTGVFEAGLFQVEGALYAISESRTAAPACGADQRAAHVGLTLYAHDVSVAQDGARTIGNLGATYVVDAPATAACPAGLAVYGAELSPVG